MAKLVSKTYGDALFEVAVEEDKVDALLEEARAVLAILEDNSDLSRLMTHPKIVKEEKMKIIEEIFSHRVSDEIVGLMRLVVQKDHFGEMNHVFEYFISTVKEYKHIGTAYVTSALDLTEKQKQDIEKKLLETTKYAEFEMHYKTDSALIGGLVIRIGDRVVDSSIRTKLNKLSSELSKLQLKVGECAS